MRLPKIKLNKKIIFPAIIVLILFLEVFWFLFLGGGIATIFSYFHKGVPETVGIILFEGDNCPNCTKVDTFIKNNKVTDKVSFTTLEVFHNVANANILADKAQTCGLAQDQIGVPFLWDGKNCILGYIDVIKFFQQKISK